MVKKGHSNNLIINFTPTGMVPTKNITPHVPIEISEIIEDVYEAYKQGITIVHIHARDQKTGAPTYKSEIYGKIIRGIREFAPELIICVSLSGRNFGEFKQRSEPLQLQGDLKPDMGSLTLSSLNFTNQASVNDPDMVQALAAEMKEKGIVPELEAFDSGMINYAHYLIKKNLIEPPFYFNLLFGFIASAQADLLHAGVMIRDLPKQSVWSLAGIGNYQLIMNSIACAIGGGLRIGLEDNIYFDRNKKKLATNQELLKRIHIIADVMEREIMSPPELRALLNLEKGYGHYGRTFKLDLHKKEERYAAQ